MGDKRNYIKTTYHYLSLFQCTGIIENKYFNACHCVKLYHCLIKMPINCHMLDYQYYLSHVIENLICLQQKKENIEGWFLPVFKVYLFYIFWFPIPCFSILLFSFFLSSNTFSFILCFQIFLYIILNYSKIVICKTYLVLNF